MTESIRKEKIKNIKEGYPALYASLEENVPNLLTDPNNASEDDISLYNSILLLHIGLIADMNL